MNENDLQLGDIIFFENHYHALGDDPSYRYIDHVAIFTGHNDQGIPEVLHSVMGDPYQPEALSGVCRTTLRALKNQIQREEGYPDKRYDVNFIVYRYQGGKKDLAEEAVEIMNYQARFRVPYDEERLKEKIELEDDHGYSPGDFKRLGEATYHSEGKFRAIKFAARYPLPLTRTRFDGVGHGVTCSMAVILAYQIAELLVDKRIMSVAKRSPGAWVSDKNSFFSSSRQTLFSDYVSALKSSPKGESREEKHIFPSCEFWIGEESEMELYQHTSFPVNAKNIGAAGLHCHMDESKSWLLVGVLNVLDRQFSDDDKVRHREQKRDTFYESHQAGVRAIRANRRLVSPAASLSPSPVSCEGERSTVQEQTVHLDQTPPWKKRLSDPSDQGNVEDVQRVLRKKRLSDPSDHVNVEGAQRALTFHGCF